MAMLLAPMAMPSLGLLGYSYFQTLHPSRSTQAYKIPTLPSISRAFFCFLAYLWGGWLRDLYRHAASSIAVYPRRSEPQSLRGYTAIELAFLHHLPIHPLPILSFGAEAICGVPEHAVLYTRPCGVPSVGREPVKRRFAPSLSAHLRRQVQPHRRLISSALQNRLKSGSELGNRLNLMSQSIQRATESFQARW
jgi:hypothetical protein